MALCVCVFVRTQESNVSKSTWSVHTECAEVLMRLSVRVDGGNRCRAAIGAHGKGSTGATEARACAWYEITNWESYERQALHRLCTSPCVLQLHMTREMRVRVVSPQAVGSEMACKGSTNRDGATCSESIHVTAAHQCHATLPLA